MSLNAAQQPTRSKSPIPSSSHDGTASTKAPTLGMPSTDPANRVTKPKWTAKWTRGQFSFYAKTASSGVRRQRPHVPARSETMTGLATTLMEHAIIAPAVVGATEQSQLVTAGEQAVGSDEAIESLARLYTNEASPWPPLHPLSTSVPDISMAHDVEAGSSAIRDHVALNSGAASVPRSFHHADLIISSDDSDQDANADKLPIMAQGAVTDDVPPVPSVESCTSLYSCGLELPTAQTKLLSPGQSKQPQRDFQAPNTAASREVIYIDSTDESERDDVDACTPIRRLTLHESSFDMPTSKAPATSAERVCSPKKTHATLFVRPQNASVETESSEDNIPLALLRERRLRNKRMRSCDEATDFALLNRPMTRLRQSVTARSQRRDFDSDAFDAMIYSQSRNKPPPGVSIPRPTKAMYVAPHDTRVFVSANPAIHGPVVRSDSWWKDKAKEIQKRPKRKQWFGKVTQRMRWLYQKQMVEEVKRHDARTRSSAAARQTRPEPQPAAYRRIMDFGDVPENQLPPDLLSNRAWVKGCAWFRKMREEDAAMRRGVEHSTQRAWQYYQTVLNNSEEWRPGTRQHSTAFFS